MRLVDYEPKPKLGNVQKRVSFGMILYYFIYLVKMPLRVNQYETLDFRYLKFQRTNQVYRVIGDESTRLHLETL